MSVGMTDASGVGVHCAALAVELLIVHLLLLVSAASRVSHPRQALNGPVESVVSVFSVDAASRPAVPKPALFGYMEAPKPKSCSWHCASKCAEDDVTMWAPYICTFFEGAFRLAWCLHLAVSLNHKILPTLSPAHGYHDVPNACSAAGR